MSGIEIAPGFAGAKRAELRAVVTRADGTVEDLGIIAETDFAPARPPRPASLAIGAAAIVGAGVLAALAARPRD